LKRERLGINGLCLGAVISLRDISPCVNLDLFLEKVLSLLTSTAIVSTIVPKSCKENLLLLLLEVIARVISCAISISIVLFIVNEDIATPVLVLFSGGYILGWLYPEYSWAFPP
jgi:hypothetical protein